MIIDWARFADCNVCGVDWSRLANYDYTIAAFHHTKTVADFVIQFIEFLMKNGLDFRQVSIVGHSLGKQYSYLTHTHMYIYSIPMTKCNSKFQITFAQTNI